MSKHSISDQSPSDQSPSDQSPSEDIPFDHSLPARCGEIQAVSPLIRRIIANNGGPFTFTGTCSYIVGRGEVVIIDPGPADPRHRDALLAAVAGERVIAILVSHTHRDHAPCAAVLKAATGAPVMGCRPRLPAFARDRRDGFGAALDAPFDLAYAPDRVLDEGEEVSGPDYRLTALATPGHTSDHLCFALAQERALFTADHVMAWSTSVVAPPDGSMRDYLASLTRLTERGDIVYWPGHGGPVRQPHGFVRALLWHRRQREAAILRCVAAGDTTVGTIVAHVYTTLAPALRGAAALSVLAHLEHLIERGLVLAEGPLSPKTQFRPA
jgi:glyoxylase-like metal-dependent hydrolase (beta-lactamase superfamily II)